MRNCIRAKMMHFLRVFQTEPLTEVLLKKIDIEPCQTSAYDGA